MIKHKFSKRDKGTKKLNIYMKFIITINIYIKTSSNKFKIFNNN